MFELTSDLIAELKSVDTPSVCNALELLVPERRGCGFTTRPLVCARPGLGAVVGIARTATIRCTPQRSWRRPDVCADSYYVASMTDPSRAWWSSKTSTKNGGTGHSGARSTQHPQRPRVRRRDHQWKC